MFELILAAIAVLGIIWVAVLTYPIILEWFQEPHVRDLVEEDANELAFTLKRELSAGNVTVVQGVFNRRTDKVHLEASRNIRAAAIDEELTDLHRGKALVVYN